MNNDQIKDARQSNPKAMTTRKIAEPVNPCTHPEHNPPSMMVFEPGTYEHECPSCHEKQVFEVPLITM